MKTFFQTCLLLCDVFRQECLNETSGELCWPRMESHCAQIVDKHSRLCKNRFKASKDEQLSSAQVDQAVISAFASLPLVKAYDVHREEGRISSSGASKGSCMGCAWACLDAALKKVARRTLLVKLLMKLIKKLLMKVQLREIPSRQLRLWEVIL